MLRVTDNSTELLEAERFVPIPAQGRVHRVGALVGPGDTAGDGRAHLDAIFRWIQDFAYADVVAAGLVNTGSWVVRRADVLIRRVPTIGEQLELSTFCGGIGGSVAERRTRIEGAFGAEVESAVIWVQIDEQTRAPAKLSDEFRGIYGPAANGRRARSRLTHPKPPADADASTWRFGLADADLADHINNVAFLRVLCDRLLLGSAVDGLELEAEYRVPVPPGPANILVSTNRLWVVDGRRSPLASFRLDGLPGDAH